MNKYDIARLQGKADFYLQSAETARASIIEAVEANDMYSVASWLGLWRENSALHKEFQRMVEAEDNLKKVK